MRNFIRFMWITLLFTILGVLIGELYYPDPPLGVCLMYILCCGLMSGDLVSSNH